MTIILPDQIINNVFPFFLGAASGGSIVGIFFGGLIKQYFDEKDRKAKHKRNVARNVLKTCNEASTGNFRTPPRDMEHVNSLLTDLQGIDEEIEKKMNNFVNLWLRLIEEYNGHTGSIHKVKYYKEMLDEIEITRKELISWGIKFTSGE